MWELLCAHAPPWRGLQSFLIMGVNWSPPVVVRLFISFADVGAIIIISPKYHHWVCGTSETWYALFITPKYNISVMIKENNFNLYWDSNPWLHIFLTSLHTESEWCTDLLACTNLQEVQNSLSAYLKWMFTSIVSFVNFKCGLGLKRDSPSIVRTIR